MVVVLPNQPLQEEKEKIIRYYYPDVYSAMTEEQQMMLYQATCDCIAKEYGLKRDYIIKIDPDKNTTHDAFYSPTSNPDYSEITISLSAIESQKNDFAYLYSVIAHELKHAEQDEIKNGIKEEFNPRVRALCSANSGSQIIKALELKGIEYRGEQIKDITRPAVAYIQIPSNQRLTSYDRTHETLLMYKSQYCERTAYETQFNHYYEFNEQMRKDGIISKDVMESNMEMMKAHCFVSGSLARLYPDSENIETDIDNVMLGAYAAKYENFTVDYRVSSKEFGWAVQWAMMNSASHQQGSKTAPSFIDPRTLIDQKIMREIETKKTIHDYYHDPCIRGDKGVVEHARLHLKLPPGKTKEYEENRIKAYMERQKPSNQKVIDKLSGWVKEKILHKENFQKKSDEELMKCFLPQKFNGMTEQTKQCLISEFINRSATELGLVGQYGAVFDHADGRYLPDSSYFINNKDTIGGNIYVVTDNQHPLDLIRGIAYSMQKAQQMEILSGACDEKYSGQRMLYEIQRQSPKAVAIRSYQLFDKEIPGVINRGDMYITKPPSKEGFMMTYSDSSTEMYAMYRFQPAERDSSKYADQKADEWMHLAEKQGGLKNDSSQKISEYCSDRYETLAKKYAMDLSVKEFENDINSSFVRTFQEACGIYPDVKPYYDETCIMVKEAMIDSFSYRTRNNIDINLRDGAAQEQLMDNIKTELENTEKINPNIMYIPKDYLDQTLDMGEWQEPESPGYLDRTLDLDATQAECTGSTGLESFEDNAFDTENLDWDDEEFDL